MKNTYKIRDHYMNKLLDEIVMDYDDDIASDIYVITNFKSSERSMESDKGVQIGLLPYMADDAVLDCAFTHDFELLHDDKIITRFNLTDDGKISYNNSEILQCMIDQIIECYENNEKIPPIINHDIDEKEYGRHYLKNLFAAAALTAGQE